MRILGMIIMGIFGLCVLLPGLCFGFFGLTFVSNPAIGGFAVTLLGAVFLVIGGLLIWGSVTIFREIGR